MKSFVNVELIKTALSRLISAFNKLDGVPYLTKAQIISAINTKYGTDYSTNKDVLIRVFGTSQKYVDIALVNFISETRGESKFGAELLTYQLPWFENLFEKDDFEAAEVITKYVVGQNPYGPMDEVEHLLLPHAVIEKGATWFTEERYYVLTKIRRSILDKRKKGIFNFFRGNKK